MRVLMLSWEYPPVMVGGLGRHVHELCRSLASIGHEVTVLTRAGEQRDSEVDEHHNGVRVVRVPPDPALPSLSTDNLIAWTLGLNHALTRAGLSLDGHFDAVHAGIGLDDDTVHLDPLPLLVRDGVRSVAVPAAAAGVG